MSNTNTSSLTMAASVVSLLFIIGFGWAGFSMYGTHADQLRSREVSVRWTTWSNTHCQRLEQKEVTDIILKCDDGSAYTVGPDAYASALKCKNADKQGLCGSDITPPSLWRSRMTSPKKTLPAVSTESENAEVPVQP